MGSERRTGTRRAPYETVLVASGAALKPRFLCVHFVTTVTVVAQNESVTATRVADTRFRCGQTFHELLELACLVQLPNLLRTSYISPTDKDSRQSQRSLTAAKDLL